MRTNSQPAVPDLIDANKTAAAPGARVKVVKKRIDVLRGLLLALLYPSYETSEEDAKKIIDGIVEFLARGYMEHPKFHLSADENITELESRKKACRLRPQKPAPDAPPADASPYIQDLFNIPLLSPEEEQYFFYQMNYLKHVAWNDCHHMLDANSLTASEISNLLSRIHDRLDSIQKIRNDLVKANLRLVISIVKKCVNWHHNELEEVISSSNFLLFTLVDSFDFAKGNKFSTYATISIKGHVTEFFNRKKRQDHTPFSDVHGTGGEETSFDAGSIPDHRNPAPEKDIFSRMQALIDVALRALDPREQSIISLRFGSDAMTLEQIGEKWSITRERVRQIEKAALEKMRAAVHAGNDMHEQDI